MENTIYLTLMILALVLMVYGLSSTIGLLNLLTIPIWVYFAIEFQTSALIVIVMVGLSLVNVIIPLKRGFDND